MVNKTKKYLKLNRGIKYSFCTCGLSKKLPFCDNAHREFNERNGTNFKSLKIEVKNNVEIEISSSTWKN